MHSKETARSAATRAFLAYFFFPSGTMQIEGLVPCCLSPLPLHWTLLTVPRKAKKEKGKMLENRGIYKYTAVSS